MHFSPTSPRNTLSSQQRRELSAAAGVDLRTVQAAYAGKPTQLASWRAIFDAAERLSIVAPPAHKAARG